MTRPAWIIGPALVGVITLATMIGAAALIYHAHADPSFAVEADYYDKAVHWDDSAAQERRNAELGWRLLIEASAADGLRMTLVDGLGFPVEGADISVEAFHNARSADRVRWTPGDAGGGVYRHPAKFERFGLWEFRVVARRASETFTVVQQRMVGAGGRIGP